MNGLSIATKFDDLGWSWTSIRCSVVSIMRVVIKRLRLESRGFLYKVALYLNTELSDVKFNEFQA